MRPRVLQADDQIGFQWATPTGTPTSLQRLVVDDDEPDRLVATHLAALDDALVIAAERFGEILGGGRGPRDPEERDDLLKLHRVLDGLAYDFAGAARIADTPLDTRAGQIIGTAALFSMRARHPLGLLGPAPLDGELDEPTIGVIGGFGEMCQVDPDKPWKGGRWVVRTEAGQRYPLTLSTLLFDSSGTNKDAARDEHREAIRSVIAAAESASADPFAVACALDWLLYDFLMAHRDGPDSAAIILGKGREADAELIVVATAASVAARATFDPGLIGLTPDR